MLERIRGVASGNPKPLEAAEVGADAAEWVASLLTSAGSPTTAVGVASRAGLGVNLSRRMLALTLARSQMKRGNKPAIPGDPTLR